MAPSARQTREASSLALSLGIHAGILLIGSLAWVAASPATPRPVQVALLELPPPTDAQAGQPASGQAERDAPDPPAPHMAARTRPRRPSAPSGPTVTATVTVAPATPHPGARPAQQEPAVIAHWQPSAKLAVNRLEMEQRRGRRERRSFALAGFGAQAQAGLLGEPMEAAEAPEEAKVDPDSLPFHVHDHGSGVLERLLPALPEPTQRGGDRRALIATIQERIDRVAPLVHRTSQGCRNASGLARIRFVMDVNGYPIGYQILASTGSACLDRQIDTLLHLAEPYPFVAGWVPVRVRFTL